MPRKAPIKKSSSPKMTSLASPTPSSPLSSPSPEPEQVKVKVEKKESPKKPIKKEDSNLSASALKKISLYEATLQQGTPFPQWDHPSPEEAQLVADRLASVHGMPNRPKVLVDKPGAAAGCGQTPDVLDALIRTILSQNTTSKNSTRAKLSMDDEYGRAEYRKVLEGGEEKLEETIRCGGLAKQKSKSIIGVLKRLDERQRNEGKGDTEQLSLDWLHQLNDADAMKELISYDLVGIKTASCVLLFCLGRSSFAVDTHVHRLTQTLGWLPPTGSVHILDSTSDPKNPTITQKSKTTTPPSRDQTFYHLDAVLPDHLKYPLHSLLVRHGRGCVKCAANGVTTQDIVDTCPIQDLIVRSRSGKKKGGGGKAKKVKVENEEGKVVGEIKEDEEGHVEVDVKPEVEKEIGERNKVKEEEEEVGVEDEVKQMKRPSRASKRAAVKQEESSESDYSEEEEDEEEEFKPAPRSAKRPKVQRSSSSTLSDSMVKTKKTASTPTKKGKKGGMTHSVDRDEAEMSGRVWKDVGEGAMHGMDG